MKARSAAAVLRAKEWTGGGRDVQGADAVSGGPSFMDACSPAQYFGGFEVGRLGKDESGRDGASGRW